MFDGDCRSFEASLCIQIHWLTMIHLHSQILPGPDGHQEFMWLVYQAFQSWIFDLKLPIPMKRPIPAVPIRIMAIAMVLPTRDN